MGASALQGDNNMMQLKYYIDNTPNSDEIEVYREEEVLRNLGYEYAVEFAEYKYEYQYYDQRTQRTFGFKTMQQHPNLIYTGKIVTVSLGENNEDD